MRITTLLKTLLGIQHVLVTGFAVEEGALVIEVRPSWRRPRCSGCQQRRGQYDTRPPRRWRHLDFGGVRIYLRYGLRRVGLLHLWGGRRSGAVGRRHDRAVHDALRGGGGLPGAAVRQDLPAGPRGGVGGAHDPGARLPDCAGLRESPHAQRRGGHAGRSPVPTLAQYPGTGGQGDGDTGQARGSPHRTAPSASRAGAGRVPSPCRWASTARRCPWRKTSSPASRPRRAARPATSPTSARRRPA